MNFNFELITILSGSLITLDVFSPMHRRRQLQQLHYLYINASAASMLISYGGAEMCHCVILQSHCMGFIEDLFNTNKVRYTVLEEMTADILKIAKDRAAQISSILGIKPQAEV